MPGSASAAPSAARCGPAGAAPLMISGISQVVLAAGLPGLRPDRLRHTYATPAAPRRRRPRPGPSPARAGSLESTTGSVGTPKRPLACQSPTKATRLSSASGWVPTGLLRRLPITRETAARRRSSARTSRLVWSQAPVSNRAVRPYERRLGSQRPPAVNPHSGRHTADHPLCRRALHPEPTGAGARRNSG
jgi:hypothetical protein